MCRSCWSRAGATIGGPYGEPTPPPSSELSAVSGCRQASPERSE
uniref:RIKEN cDNA 4930562C15 gene n=1 Tax=Mus musculus TaxID=10090 RepID=H3BJT7_MOUSE